MREKREAARSKNPGKNPKTQREEQSDRLVLRRREHAPACTGVNRKFHESSDILCRLIACGLDAGAGEAARMAISGMDLRFFY